MSAVAAPYSVLAELTHRCPLHCPYCSNPLQLVARPDELGTEEWCAVLRDAAALGVVQVGFSGGEPLARADLETIVGVGSRLGLYTNLITSGVGLTPHRVAALAAAGLNSVQLSIQAAEEHVADWIAGCKAHSRKASAAGLIRDAQLPLTLNVVLHRRNIDQIEQIIDLAVDWDAQRLELANAQYYGWALLNRDALLPTSAQLEDAKSVVDVKKAQLHGRLELIWVISDYYEALPKPCMGGWGEVALTVAPNGQVMPCPAAAGIEPLRFDSVRDHRLEWIWRYSNAFNRYRGDQWMVQPCRECPRRHIDFGGCRCQAFALTGGAARTDPVCVWSPDHHVVEAIVPDTAPGESPYAVIHRYNGGDRHRARRGN